ncbi:XRE family transcriptional regulator [Nonomuraea phyllanthi]|uniref:XRE family transcriptional regulator n=1 Tax=Nonomuraea phyllanthi TaxID=2219224 RepID=A0A5C4WVD9_9ACTN|nr:helix-turn-helix transcriptional regulator [Nonomuraea phyllanthi]KAB8197211.1 XRE family transcriptional regulator [Nonomuraea phyllanthi]
MNGDGSGLARRLRELRDGHWPEVRVTQAQLREAFAVSVPLISSWESAHTAKVPPLPRLEKYAAFFATRRSIANGRARVLPLSDLTPDEVTAYHELLDELTRLRKEALRTLADGEGAKPAQAGETFLKGPWHFPRGESITIICSQIPEEHRARIPYADPTRPDYIELYKYSDLDSLFELWGHLRAANPHSPLTLRATEDLRSSDDLTTHVVLLGGVDYNEVTQAMLEQIELPVRQVPDWDGEKGPYFEVDEGGDTRRHYTVTSGSGDNLQLLEDVGFFYRGVNPENVERTLTICNGMYARGVYGTVRALTDKHFRDRNAGYLRDRFGDAASYSILTRVRIVGRVAVTPDWARESFRLHEWPEPANGD